MAVDYKAIADDVAANGDADYQAAFARMSAETVTEDLPSVRITEAGVISRLGLTDGEAILDAIESAPMTSPRVKRLIQLPDGINLADAAAKGFINALQAGGHITPAQKTMLMDLTRETKPKWPGLQPGHVQNAIDWRSEGKI